jgi:hypothetical protein
MSGLRPASIDAIRVLERSLRQLPRVLAARVARAAAQQLTELGRATFRNSQNAYGDPWAPGAEGQTVTLRKSGALAGTISYVATGTRLRAHLGPRYAKYQVGKRPVFPRFGATLPQTYSSAIHARAAAEIAAAMKEATQ